MCCQQFSTPLPTLFMVYSLSFNLADLNCEPGERSTSIRYINGSRAVGHISSSLIFPIMKTVRSDGYQCRLFWCWGDIVKDSFNFRTVNIPTVKTMSFSGHFYCFYLSFLLFQMAFIVSDLLRLDKTISISRSKRYGTFIDFRSSLVLLLLPNFLLHILK